MAAGCKRLGFGRLFGAAALLGLTLAFSIPPVLAGGNGTYEGVASCAGSTCHGRLAPSGHVVRQNEIFTWQDESSPSGAHSRAFRVLTQSRGKAIASRLGLGEAQRAQACLGCHLGDVPTEKHGPRFLNSDGVGCEACHGPSGGWLATHYSVGTPHKTNVDHGLVKLEDVKTRAALCLDCHYGTDKPGYVMTHRIMAAGHPRLSFELDLFGALQSHYDFHADYEQRKLIPGQPKMQPVKFRPTKLWAVARQWRWNACSPASPSARMACSPSSISTIARAAIAR